MMKVGFELEAFCISRATAKPILVPPPLPFDECGWLVETRSEPHTDVRKAIHLLKAEIEATDEKAAKADVNLIYTPLYEIPRDLKVQAARKYTKGTIKYRNLYGFETHRCPTRLATASLHISFTNQQTFRFTTGPNNTPQEFNYSAFIDWGRIFVSLDKIFAKEIKAAGRNPGFYEVKGDGRIEYRSLPDNVDLGKVQDTLINLLK